jgi:hypothetical protein
VVERAAKMAAMVLLGRQRLQRSNGVFDGADQPELDREPSAQMTAAEYRPE